jgi:hypothetical protein
MNGDWIAGQACPELVEAARNDNSIAIADWSRGRDVQRFVIPDLIRDPYGVGKDSHSNWMADLA